MIKKIENIQAILINPKWAEHGFDTFAGTTTASQNTEDDDSSGSNNPKQKRQGKGGLKPQQAQKSDFKD